MGLKSSKVKATSFRGSNKYKKHGPLRKEDIPENVLTETASTLIGQRKLGYPGKSMAEPTLEKVQENDTSTSSSASTSTPTQFQFEQLKEYEITLRAEKIPFQEATTSMTGFLEDESELTCSLARSKKPKTVDVKTSTPKIVPCFCPDTIFYQRNQHVGAETRHTEFKRGGVVFDQRAFRTLIGRYLCAFLNTEGGVIYFGVTDDGKVVGIKINQKMEDEIRINIDSVVSSIVPNVATAAYTINFANIMNEQGQFDRDMKVIEICVHPRIPPRSMHSFDGNTYIRRDGSLRTV